MLLYQIKKSVSTSLAYIVQGKMLFVNKLIKLEIQIIEQKSVQNTQIKLKTMHTEKRKVRKYLNKGTSITMDMETKQDTGKHRTFEIYRSYKIN